MSTDVTGDEILFLIEKLYPICRSITGNGVRETLQELQKLIPLIIYEVPTGTKVFDWEVPREWNINSAWIKDPGGIKIVDFRDHNLHVLNYSVPVSGRFSLENLKEHLHTLPEQPDLIPYRTSYYKEDWGFCITHNLYKKLQKGDYEVHIDSSLSEGSLTYGEYVVKGKSDKELLISCHNCHPSLANDNLSGVCTAVYLARYLTGKNLRYSYRFLFIPGTIGSITWLAKNRTRTHKISHAIVLSCIGDPGDFTYKRSRRGDADIDRIVENTLRHVSGNADIRDFMPYGYDERQYCSPAFNLPAGCLMRSHFGEFPEYHTSADNPSFLKAGSLEESFRLLCEIINSVEGNEYYINLNPECEPNLGKRGLYSMTGGQKHTKQRQLSILWVLNLSDGRHSLLDISVRSGLPFRDIRSAADDLLKTELLREANKH